jgi:hypothetical protein
MRRKWVKLDKVRLQRCRMKPILVFARAAWRSGFIHFEALCRKPVGWSLTQAFQLHLRDAFTECDEMNDIHPPLPTPAAKVRSLASAQARGPITQGRATARQELR